jgi:hypothetical protein
MRREVDPATIELARMLRFPKHSIDATFRLNVDELPTVTVTYHPEDERGNIMLAHDCLRVIEARFELYLREQRDVTPPFDMAAAIAEASKRIGERIDTRCDVFRRRCAHEDSVGRFLDRWLYRLAAVYG